MGYQALLFCPDEKTARTVTQVLSELDFTVVPCTEPFAAVKKLMGEHFDAVVVDCDNEQNATLLFKSARNSPNNNSSLAVAVVEGQAGVAKAFRIGANLVLTKPINVEQAKGTLRVARGLLRKNETAKSAPAATAAQQKPAASAPAPAKPVLVVPSGATPRTAAPVATAKIATPKQAPQTNFGASASSAITESAESTESIKALPKPTAPPSMPKSAAPIASTKILPSASAEPEPASSQPEVPAPSSVGFSASTGAASAPVRAREAKPSVSTQDKTSAVIAEPKTPVEEVAASASSSPVQETAVPAPSFTFGGTVGSGTESAGGGSKKVLFAVAAVVLIAAVGYFAWTQWGHSMGATNTPAAVTTRPVTTTPAAPPSAPITTGIAPSSSVSAPVSDTSTVPTSTVAEQPSASTQISSTTEANPGADNKPAHPSKASAGVEPSKHAVSVVAVNKAPAKSEAAQPIVVKNGNSQPVVGKTETSTDAPAPSLSGIAPAGNGGSLPNLMTSASSAPTPVLQVVNVSQGISQGLVIKKTQPIYPPNALRMRIEGSVQLMATISKKGDISVVKILSGDPGLARAAVDAVKQWKYKPYLLDGSPVEIQTQITVNFKLPQ